MYVSADGSGNQDTARARATRDLLLTQASAHTLGVGRRIQRKQQQHDSCSSGDQARGRGRSTLHSPFVRGKKSAERGQCGREARDGCGHVQGSPNFRTDWSRSPVEAPIGRCRATLTSGRDRVNVHDFAGVADFRSSGGTQVGAQKTGANLGHIDFLFRLTRPPRWSSWRRAHSSPPGASAERGLKAGQRREFCRAARDS